jgi:hypothetical protein
MKKKRNGAQLVMHVTSEDHRMNVTDSENGKNHQCGKVKGADLQTKEHLSERMTVGRWI